MIPHYGMGLKVINKKQEITQAQSLKKILGNLFFTVVVHFYFSYLILLSTFHFFFYSIFLLFFHI